METKKPTKKQLAEACKDYVCENICKHTSKKAAEFVSQYFKKGQQMALEGRLQVRSYDDNNGQRRWVTEVVTEKVEFVGSKGGNGNSSSNGAGSGSGGGNTGNSGAASPSQLGWGEEIVFDDNDLPF